MSLDAAVKPEKVRLVIWDLDDTFWSGTLTEGGITIIERNVEIVKTLSARGIVNSICSKNDPARAQAELEKAGIWEYFVLARIAWEGKGAMVKSIVEASQLRPETIMFIDDNTINLNEVRHYNPAVQLAEPDFLEVLLDDPRFAGKDDSGLTRLAQYKVLEKKEQDQRKFSDSNRDFLRQSEIQISFHPDVLAEFDRVHELINRTNQLNFTKQRVPEDRDQAYAELSAKLEGGGRTNAAYVKVSDKYGAYGIVGFYVTSVRPVVGRKLEHFLFSCRTLNMGIEQFVYRKLSRPYLEVVGEVVADVKTHDPIDWITVVPDAEQRGVGASLSSKSVCMRGSCDLDQLIHYLGHRYNISKDFPYPYKGALVASSAAQYYSIVDELARPENRQLAGRVPFLHHNLFKTGIQNAGADVYVISFAMEEQWSYFRYKPTGLELPMRMGGGVTTSCAELTSLAYADVERLTQLQFSEADWQWFVENFEYAGEFDMARFERNMVDLFKRLAGKQIIFVLANTRHGKPSKSLEINAQINAVIERVAAPYAPHFVRFDDLIAGAHEVRDANHFRREVFPRLAEAVRVIIDNDAQAAEPPRAEAVA